MMKLRSTSPLAWQLTPAMLRLASMLCISFLISAQSFAQSFSQTILLPQAHAHNDYEHPHPLYDALEHGFMSVEADIYLHEGALLVGHDPEDLAPERTLQSLYLDPLMDIAQSNNGYIQHREKSFLLLIDIKTDADSTWAVLQEVLASYAPMLTRYTDTDPTPGAVTILLSGNRPRETLQQQPVRLAGYDARFEDLGVLPASFAPMVSGNWTTHFTWTGEGEMPEHEKALFSQIRQAARSNGQRLRFWATPDMPGPARERLWSFLLENDVDFINTDDLAGLRTFLIHHDATIHATANRD